ncbi:UDP-N-acetylglucosamine 2-epimerase [Dyadobacter arcticus]|uniref:UDP-hydrolysing UDP-N-acetyl-D-glucosamine 2-epimerase n=1 Tax=Dyadobacter arcticus TaxID=1078754 RepID=A0ABX0UU57_9BACT|nr:UDP-N-acetylglucosamine 2-epimerase [Dyadobacter arcticus]NIJ55335.1 UDP-hydrolysing UDP-N-acetyl-D-glucosamine 2-epimerase [Dyadobacter arcticus]
MRKICVVVSARASYSRSKTLLSAIKEHSNLQLQLVVMASALLNKFGHVASNIESDGFEITAIVTNCLEAEYRTSAAKTTGLGIIELATIFDHLRPDVVVTIADRFETMSTAIAASYMNIPLAHIQGGEVTGNIDEKVRHAITKLADIHFVATKDARSRVIRLGERPETVHLTGCPSIDLALETLNTAAPVSDPCYLYGGIGLQPDLSNPYLMVLQHSVTSESECAKIQIDSTLEAVRLLGMPTLWFWPNSDPGTCEIAKGIRTFHERNPDLPVHFFKNIPYATFLHLIHQCACLVGNSSTGIREGACLGVPTVNIGSRQSGRERGKNVVDAEPETGSIVTAIKYQLTQSRYTPNFLYGDGHAGVKIAQILAEIPLTFEKKITY